jgi:hypothetical protein
MLYLALSALQGRPMASAFAELAALGAGIQLTPGNLPTPSFEAHVAASNIPTRRHHGFSYHARRAEVWRDGACVTDAESVHPPAAGAPWRDWYSRAVTRPIIEVMYPGQALGTGDEVEAAMADALPLAVDVSHVFIQRAQGAMTEATWRRLQAYPHIAEVHVSANDGRRDAHLPLRADSFGLDWARERLASTPVVLECYMHRMEHDARRAQLDLIRETR